MTTDQNKALMDAIKLNDWNAVEKALGEGAKAQGTEGDGAPLLEAARNENFVIAGILVAAGASIRQSKALAGKRQDAFNWGEDPVHIDYQRDYVANNKADDWLTSQRQEITERALDVLARRVTRLEGVEQQLADLKAAVDEIVNPKALEKRKLQTPKVQP